MAHHETVRCLLYIASLQNTAKFAGMSPDPAVGGKEETIGVARKCSGELIEVGGGAGETRQADPLDSLFRWAGPPRPGIPARYLDGNGQAVTATVDSIFVGKGKWIPTKTHFIGAG